MLRNVRIALPSWAICILVKSRNRKLILAAESQFVRDELVTDSLNTVRQPEGTVFTNTRLPQWPEGTVFTNTRLPPTVEPVNASVRRKWGLISRIAFAAS